MDTAQDRVAVVVGAGIAGLATGIALTRRGWSVEILELQPEGRTAGWGLSLTGPALRALRSLRLDEELIANGYGMTRIVNWEPSGEAVEIAPPRLLGDDAPAMVGISRPALQRTLARAAADLGVQVSYGSTVTGIDQEADHVLVHLRDGGDRRARLVVGADGIRSSVRDLLGLAGAPRSTGQAVWRARVPRPAWATGINTFSLTDRQMGVVPISADDAYVFFTENAASREPVPDDRLAEAMRAQLEPFADRAGELRDSIRQTDGIVRRLAQTTVVDGAWNVGNAVIIGDATHAPSPQTASGAALAIEDAAVLAEELDRSPAVADALDAFTARRGARCATLVTTSERIAELEQAGRHRESHELVDRCYALMAQPA